MHALQDLLDTIPDAAICKLTASVLAQAPESFWTAPSSTSGKYHPADELGQGGLVLHTRKVFALARLLMLAYRIGPASRTYSVILAAALLHDAWKVLPGERYSRFEHPLLASAVIQDCATQQGFSAKSKALADLLHCVESHMGIWNTNKHAEGIILPLPETDAALVLHLADFIASRRAIIIDTPALLA